MKVVALVLGACLVVSGCGGQQQAGPPAQGTPASVTRVLALPSQSDVERAARSRLESPRASSLTLEDLRGRASDVAANTPVDRYDLASRARTLPAGVEAALGFVRDHVRYEAYSGVLRGAGVTYTARAGNAFDRSLLLAELLRAKGIATRFALGTLGRPEAERLFARIFEPSRPEADARTPALTATAEGQALLARLRARAARDLAAIRAALGPAVPTAAPPSFDAVLKEIEDHAWVQALVGGQWVDLDSAFADAVPGRAYTRADSTVEVFPATVYQRVAIRVVTEWVTGGALSHETVLDVTVPAEQLLDREVHLLHGPGNADISGAITRGILGSQGGEPWVPMLWLDGETHVGMPFAFLDQEQPAPRGSPPSGGLRGVFGPGGALGSNRQFVSERLEVEIIYPGDRRELTQRVLVDRADTAWRLSTREGRALRPLERDQEGLIAPRVVHNLWFSAGRHNLAAYVQAVDELFQAVRFGVPPPATSDLTIGEQLWPLAVQNFALLVVSDHIIVPSLNDGTGYRFYADSPRLLIASFGPDAQAGSNRLAITYDLRRDHVRGLAQSAATAQAVHERKIWFGLLQGALEHDMAEQLVTGERASTAEATSTSSLLTGDGVNVLRPGVPPASGALPPDPEAAARVMQALSAGRTVLIPRGVLRGGPWGWWELSPDGELHAVLGGLMGGVLLSEFRGGSRFGGSRGGSGGKSNYVDPTTYSSKPPKKPARPGRAAGKQQSGGTDQYVGMIKWIVGLVAVLVLDTALYHTVGIGANILGSMVSAVLSDGSP